jgi:hypothetical protein
MAPSMVILQPPFSRTTSPCEKTSRDARCHSFGAQAPIPPACCKDRQVTLEICHRGEAPRIADQNFQHGDLEIQTSAIRLPPCSAQREPIVLG